MSSSQRSPEFSELNCARYESRVQYTLMSLRSLIPDQTIAPGNEARCIVAIELESISRATATQVKPPAQLGWFTVDNVFGRPRRGIREWRTVPVEIDGSNRIDPSVWANLHEPVFAYFHLEAELTLVARVPA
ncbi:hypothetical protein N7492_006095 [Penicillium capsulatum]|uniref:Uncharacterized protein n=1 Tax=Penicillium capsulatum TaxID=69766 RepID=A0A9W9I3G9_9EURO|nr:hypothetical protein N7492_006095 [Penicillium capsulatum]KAJ6108745.1 hypothetical protein N7512_008582 [Penicillium capsulatum]